MFCCCCALVLFPFSFFFRRSKSEESWSFLKRTRRWRLGAAEKRRPQRPWPRTRRHRRTRARGSETSCLPRPWLQTPPRAPAWGPSWRRTRFCAWRRRRPAGSPVVSLLFFIWLGTIEEEGGTRSGSEKERKKERRQERAGQRRGFRFFPAALPFEKTMHAIDGKKKKETRRLSKSICCSLVRLDEPLFFR